VNGIGGTIHGEKSADLGSSAIARTARCAVFMAPIVLTACQLIVLDPQGPIGLAQKTILIDSLAIMLVAPNRPT
jgi:hypothetical protein